MSIVKKLHTWASISTSASLTSDLLSAMNLLLVKLHFLPNLPSMLAFFFFMGNAKENEQGANMGRICEEIWLVRTTSLNCGRNSGRDVCRGERGSFHR
jgi:hypothetical protein